jgi:hypothetical protein
MDGSILLWPLSVPKARSSVNRTQADGTSKAGRATFGGQTVRCHPERREGALPFRRESALVFRFLGNIAVARDGRGISLRSARPWGRCHPEGMRSFVGVASSSAVSTLEEACSSSLGSGGLRMRALVSPGLADHAHRRGRSCQPEKGSRCSSWGSFRPLERPVGGTVSSIRRRIKGLAPLQASRWLSSRKGVRVT